MTEDIVDRMKAALRPIAKEADDWETYILGNNCYGPDCPPDLRADYPTRIPFKLLAEARAALAEAEKLGPAEIVWADLRSDGKIAMSTVTYHEPNKLLARQPKKILLIPILDQPKEPV